jgi:hypothetical protein
MVLGWIPLHVIWLVGLVVIGIDNGGFRTIEKGPGVVFLIQSCMRCLVCCKIAMFVLLWHVISVGNCKFCLHAYVCWFWRVDWERVRGLNSDFLHVVCREMEEQERKWVDTKGLGVISSYACITIGEHKLVGRWGRRDGGVGEEKWVEGNTIIFLT